MPTIFSTIFKHDNNQLLLVAAKIVDYIKVAAAGGNAERFLTFLMKLLNLEGSRPDIIKIIFSVE